MLEAQEGDGLEDEEEKEEGNLGVSFGGDDDNEDASSAGDSFEQHELERYDEDDAPPGALTDLGTGAFDSMAIKDLPDIVEDVMYRDEQERLALEAAEEDAAERARHETSFSEMLLGHAAEAGGVDADVDYKLSELPITFPSQWAAADYLNGRDWWIAKGGLELETYLGTKPFETYRVYRGRYHPNPTKSTRRCVGSVKAIIRVLDEDPQFEVEPFFPMALLSPRRYAVRVYVIRASNLQPVDGGSCDAYARPRRSLPVSDHPRRRRGAAATSLRRLLPFQTGLSASSPRRRRDQSPPTAPVSDRTIRVVAASSPRPVRIPPHHFAGTCGASSARIRRAGPRASS